MIKVAIAAMVIGGAALSQHLWLLKSFKPGDLITPHAQILSGTVASESCAACHPAATFAVSDWFSPWIASHHEATQNDRCLDCHHQAISRATASLAHNLPAETRESIRLASRLKTTSSWHDLLPSPAVDQEQVKCGACHREHHGGDANLSAVSDLQCQTCHADRFGSFATSHPEWDGWPYGRGQPIMFNHATHANEHFPATKLATDVAQFQCGDCHQRTAAGELTRAISYERGCQSCHDRSLTIQAAEGIELFAVPTIPAHSTARTGSWPAAATGFYDGQLSPLAELLLGVDATLKSSLQQLPQGDFGRLDDADRESVQAAELIAANLKLLIDDVADRGQAAIVDRLVASGLTPSSAATVIRSLPTQLVDRARQDWFDAANRQAATHDDDRRPIQLPNAAKPDHDQLLLLELSTSDPLESDPLANPGAISPSTNDRVSRPPSFDPDAMLPGGGWYQDDRRLAIRYRAGGHADPVLRSAIELIRQLPEHDPVRMRWLQTPGIAACVTCHRSAVQTDGQWTSPPRIGQRREFTKFAHGPHLNISSLLDCTHCHQISASSAAGSDVTSVGMDSAPHDRPEFAPLQKSACAVCHTPHAAGDACIKCHRYHIDSPLLLDAGWTLLSSP
jgi:hypothetical protein